MGAGAAVPLLGAAVNKRLELDGPAKGESAHPLRAAELVSTDADHVRLACQPGHVEPGNGLHGVGVEYSARRPPPHQSRHFCHGLDGPHLVVDELHRHDADVPVQCRRQRVQVHYTIARYPYHADRDAERPARGFRGVQHGVVLYGTDDYRAGKGARPAEYGEIGRLRPAAGEDNVTRAGPEAVRNRIAGFVDRLASRSRH